MKLVKHDVRILRWHSVENDLDSSVENDLDKRLLWEIKYAVARKLDYSIWEIDRALVDMPIFMDHRRNEIQTIRHMMEHLNEVR